MIDLLIAQVVGLINSIAIIALAISIGTILKSKGGRK